MYLCPPNIFSAPPPNNLLRRRVQIPICVFYCNLITACKHNDLGSHAPGWINFNLQVNRTLGKKFGQMAWQTAKVVI